MQRSEEMLPIDKGTYANNLARDAEGAAGKGDIKIL